MAQGQPFFPCALPVPQVVMDGGKVGDTKATMYLGRIFNGGKCIYCTINYNQQEYIRIFPNGLNGKMAPTSCPGGIAL